MAAATTTNPATATRAELVEYLKAADAYAGHSRDSIDQLRQLVADHQAQAEPAEPAEPVADTPDLTDVPQDEVFAKAKAEHKAAAKAKAAGQPMPATPYLDELNRRYQAGEKKPRKAKANGTRATRTPDPRYVAAEAAREAGGRGDTRKLTDDELAAYIAKVRTEHPEGTAAGELQVARHVDGVSVSLQRWNAAWKAHTA